MCLFTKRLESQCNFMCSVRSFMYLLYFFNFKLMYTEESCLNTKVQIHIIKNTIK